LSLSREIGVAVISLGSPNLLIRQFSNKLKNPCSSVQSVANLHLINLKSVSIRVNPWIILLDT